MKSSNIGGQAVMEGIMMRHGDVYSVAVRKPDKEIEIKVEDYKSIIKNKKILSLPIIRGVFNFIDSLVVGTKCLMYSATFFEEEEDYRKRKELQGEEREKEEAKKEKEDKILMTLTVCFSVVFSVALFMVLPYLLASLLHRVGATETLVTIAEAAVRILLFLLYMFLISKMEDIQRVFMYHGAEHKCINCVEHGLPLTVENVMKSSRFHKRCGTSFLFFVIIVSIIFFIGFFAVVPVKTMWLRVVIRILLVPAIAGISYEFIRLAGNSDNPAVAFLSKPGLALQKLTTKEPTPDMTEVAIAAVEAVFDWKEYLRENFPDTVIPEEPLMMKNYRELLEFGKSRLEEQGIENPRLDAWFLMEYVFQISRTWYFLHEEEQPGEKEEKQYIELIEKRGAHIPLQQLTHEAYFYGLKFYVDENVLAPRPDTEILVEQVLENLPGDQELEILDMCTGSGCILLSILANRPKARGIGADLSEKALAVAEKNGRDLGIKARWIHSDLFEKIQEQYDVIVSNPPYIRTDVIQGLMEEVRFHEPYMALDGHDDGLYFYRKIIAQAGDYLKPEGLLAFEIGYDQGEAVSSLMKTQGYTQVHVFKDLAGLDRVVTGRRNQEEKYV